MHRVTNTLDHIPKEILQESFKSFLRSVEVYIGKRGAKDIDSKTVIKDFLRDDKKLYRGNEIILHCFCVVAVKFSVESSVESLISRYECHFDKSRQLSQERSTQEMFLSENGPILVGISYHVLFHDYINITICMALLLCEEILRLLYNRCMQTSCSRERWTSSLSVKPIVQHGIFTIQMWQGFMNQTIPKPSKGCKLEIKIELCWQIGEHVKWNDSEFLTTTNNAVWLKK